LNNDSPDEDDFFFGQKKNEKDKGCIDPDTKEHKRYGPGIVSYFDF
jgi:hypothetical protein